jgi:hypothetical protein
MDSGVLVMTASEVQSQMVNGVLGMTASEVQ